MVAILRLDADAHPDDVRTTELVGELTLKSPELSRWWSQHKVPDRTWGHKRFRHPIVGPLEIDDEALALVASWHARSSGADSPGLTTDRQGA